jgi:hypothetical protein
MQQEEPLFLNGERIPEFRKERGFFEQLRFTMLGASIGMLGGVALRAATFQGLLPEKIFRTNSVLSWLIRADHPAYPVEQQQGGYPYFMMGRLAWIASLIGTAIDLVVNVLDKFSAVRQDVKRVKMLNQAIREGKIVKLTENPRFVKNVFAQVESEEYLRPSLADRVIEEQQRQTGIQR